MANKKDVQNSPQKTNNFMFSLNITFLADYTRFYLINAHHAEIPGPETAAQSAAMNMPAERYGPSASRLFRLLTFMRMVWMTDPRMHARINAKIMFFAPKSRPAYAMSLMSPPPIALPAIRN